MKALIPLVVMASVLAQPQARDVQQPTAGTAVLSGTVVADEPSGQPVRRALITVLTNDARQQYQTSTDDRGRFSIAGLPTGNVRLIVAKPSYVQTYYGARQPGSTVGLPIALTNGQAVDVTVRLPRGSVIAGTVRDENGQPMPGVGVRVQRVTVAALGQRTFTSTSAAFIPSTDDRGAFRVFGLAAGDYVVSAQPRLAAGAEVRQTSATELQWAERQIRGGGGGGASGSSGDSDAAPVSGRTITYASVFFPGTAKVASAGVVSLATGEERNGIDLRMQFVPTARIDGVVLNPAGQPASGMQVSLFPKDGGSPVDADAARLAAMMEVGLMAGGTSRTDPAGAFSFAGVEPGAYIVLARTGPVGRGGAAAGGGTMLSAMTDVEIDGRDVSGVSLRLAPGQTVSGRFVFEGRTAVTTPTRVTVSMRAVDATGFSTSVQFPLATATDPFEVAGLSPAAYRASASIAGWTLKSVTTGGRDVTDVPVQIKTGEDLSDIVVIFTDSPAEVSGTLYDAAGRLASDLSIVLFSTDRMMWFSGSRRVRPSVRPANDGKFLFSGLASGEYYMAALTEVSPADLAAPQFLEQVVPAAFKITVGVGEKKVQDIKVVK